LPIQWKVGALLLEEGAACCNQRDGEKRQEDQIENCILPKAGQQRDCCIGNEPGRQGYDRESALDRSRKEEANQVRANGCVRLRLKTKFLM